MGETRQSSERLVNLQALRGIAAISVLLGHLGSLGRIVPEVATFGDAHLVVGVDIFFVLSGFIACHVSATNWGDWAGYASRRVTRIYPLYWLVAILTAPIFYYVRNAFSGHVLDGWDYQLRSFLLLPVLSSDGNTSPSVQVAWTLIFEIYFYAMVVLSMFAPRRYFPIAILVLLAAGHALSYALPDGPERAFLSHTVQFEFLFGVGIWYLWRRGLITPPALVIAGAIAAVLFLFGAPAEPFRFVSYGGIATIAVMAALYLEGRRIVAPRVAVYLGDASYAIYLFHPPVIEATSKWLMPISGIGKQGFAAILAVATLLLCCAIYSLVDRPSQSAIKWGRGRIQRKTAPIGATEPAS